jgi:NADH:ubiquinone oxidoreductase subunit 4 (subunit M)
MLAAIVVYGLSKHTFDSRRSARARAQWIFLGFVAAFADQGAALPAARRLPDAYASRSPEVAAVLSGVVSKAAGVRLSSGSPWRSSRSRRTTSARRSSRSLPLGA